MPEVRDLVEEDDRHDEGYEAENGRAGHTERADDRYREHGSEYETAVAAYGKEAQAQPLEAPETLLAKRAPSGWNRAAPTLRAMAAKMAQ